MNFEKYNKFKIKKFDIDLDKVELYEETKTQTKVVFFDERLNDFNFIHLKDFFTLYSKHNKEFIDFLNKNYTSEKLKDKIAEFILDFKTSKKNYKFIKYDLDLTAKKPYIKTKDNTIILTYNTLAMPKNLKQLQKVLNIVDVDNIDIKEYKHYIRTYVGEHFEELNDVLQFIVLFLFYTDKKSSFMNIISPSDFGKTDFFIDIMFKRLNFAFKTEHKIIEYTPSPLSYTDFIRKGALIIDEFTIYRKEFKTMTNEYTLNPKGEKQIEVSMFSKLFFSKEKSKSFTGVVDSQILNRVLLVDKSKTNRTIPKFLNKHKEIDAEKLKDYLTIYYFRFIKKYVNYYKNLNFEERQAILKSKLDKLKAKYRIKNVETTEEYIKKVFYANIANILELLENKKENEIIISYGYDDEFAFKLENNILYINKFETYLTYILKKENEQYYNNVKFSLSNNNILEVVENNKSKRIKGKIFTTTAVKLNFEELKQYAENITLDTKDKQIKELQEKLFESEKEKKDLRENLLNIITKNFDYNKANLETLNNKELLEFLDDLIQTNLTNTIIKNNENKPNSNNNIEEIGDFTADEIFDNDEEFPF